MSQAPVTSVDGFVPVSESTNEERAQFLLKSYAHLFGAIVAFVLLSVFWQLLNPGAVMATMFASPWSWLVVLGAFMGVSMLAEWMVRSSQSLGIQYAGLGLYVLFESIIFIPMIYIATLAEAKFGVPIITPAAFATAVIFAALTAVVFITRKDFGFLRPALYMMGIGAILLIVAAIIFGFNLGVIFSVAMVVFASLWILYDTSEIMHRYQNNQYVAASLALFAAVALLFWYVLRIGIWLASFADD